MIIFSVGADSLYHGKVTWCFWNFTKFNLIEGRSSYFGEQGLVWLSLIVPNLFRGWIIFLPIGMFIYNFDSIDFIRLKIK